METLSNIGPNTDRKGLIQLLPLTDIVSADAVSLFYLCTQYTPEARLQMFSNFFQYIQKKKDPKVLIWNTHLIHGANKHRNETQKDAGHIEMSKFINEQSLGIKKDLDIITDIQMSDKINIEVCEIFKNRLIIKDVLCD